MCFTDLVLPLTWSPSTAALGRVGPEAPQGSTVELTPIDGGDPELQMCKGDLTIPLICSIIRCGEDIFPLPSLPVVGGTADCPPLTAALRRAGPIFHRGSIVDLFLLVGTGELAKRTGEQKSCPCPPHLLSGGMGRKKMSTLSSPLAT